MKKSERIKILMIVPVITILSTIVSISVNEPTWAQIIHTILGISGIISVIFVFIGLYFSWKLRKLDKESTLFYYCIGVFILAGIIGNSFPIGSMLLFMALALMGIYAWQTVTLKREKKTPQTIDT